MAIGDGRTARYCCLDDERHAALRAAIAGGLAINGIDFLEVLDAELLELSAGPGLGGLPAYRQRVLLLQLFAAAPTDLRPAQVLIRGGERVAARCVWTRRLDQLGASAATHGAIPAVLRTALELPAFDRFTRSTVLAIGTDTHGDAAPYRLTLINDPIADPTPRAGFDPRLAEVAFTFKAECPTPFDCADPQPCAAPEAESPLIDYLAKDWSSFRRLMLDRMSVVLPEWRERLPADLGVALVELLAYQADFLSYAQDAAQTEAYLGTARRRTSLRRHARRVDYFVDEGTSARAFVALAVGATADGQVLPAGTRFLSLSPGLPPRVDAADVQRRRREGALVFESAMPLKVRAGVEAIAIHSWSDRQCALPRGSTQVTLVGRPPLERGDLLLLEEVVGGESGLTADADLAKRHVVRLIDLRPTVDPLNAGLQLTEAFWHEADALPFALCLSTEHQPAVARAAGNILVADHGFTSLEFEEVGTAFDLEPFRPLLREGPLSHPRPLPERFVLAAGVDRATLAPRNVLPAAALREEGPGLPAIVACRDAQRSDWGARRDLLGSGPFDAGLVAEVEDDGRARLRFGDNVNGRAPEGKVEVRYRVGNGPVGNLGADLLRHVEAPFGGILAVRNPLPGWGGRRPESAEEIRRYAPEAYRVQERAITAEDWARAAERHPEVARAQATFRWTGSWTTVFLTVDRRLGRPLDDAFEEELRTFLERFRVAGYDLEIDRPRPVSLDLALRVCVASGHDPSAVRRELLRALGSGRGADGRPGLFHPDAWTFGQPVYLSPIYAAAAAVAGVGALRVERFQRADRPGAAGLTDGVLPMGRLEIARLDNDPSRPENGRLELDLRGGR
jgi:hypothetical protein